MFKKRFFLLWYRLKDNDVNSDSFFMTFAGLLKASGGICFWIFRIFLFKMNTREDWMPQDSLWQWQHFKGQPQHRKPYALPDLRRRDVIFIFLWHPGWSPVPCVDSHSPTWPPTFSRLMQKPEKEGNSILGIAAKWPSKRLFPRLCCTFSNFNHVSLFI